jgi:hypothetical protein
MKPRQAPTPILSLSGARECSNNINDLTHHKPGNFSYPCFREWNKFISENKIKPFFLYTPFYAAATPQ